MLAPPAPLPPRRTVSRFVHLVTFGAAVSASSLPQAAIAQAQGAGSIQGTITVPERPPRRTLERYAGSGTASRTLQHVPVVVYIEGSMDGAMAAPPSSVQVAQKDTAFVPAVLVVPRGTSVNFPNRDPFFHNVISFSPAKRFDLGRYPRGESKSVVFDRAGVVKVYCEVHEFMRAAVVVVENPHHAIVGSDGRFALRDVPAGRHRLVVWDAERRPRKVDVTVTAGTVTSLNVTLP